MGVLDRIRGDLENFVGQRIKVKANRGRKKVMEAEGILEGIYPKLFVVRLNERQSERRVSYSYADLLTETVELSIEDTRIGLGEATG
ncbi:MAG TPA: Veg protein [Firmicutes bacterium]|nr:Veg protein [Bacillota bacterium]HAW70031.1 Veg protein [Bacillota bacterium]HAZ20898.1 Veg protein [Bacillota bacterium]HBE05686.1 Veg protein [Bacillota bacterium]HBG43688.1 Veg protein [Bacillota bacterium]